MKLVTEEQSARLATHELAYRAVREALMAAVDPKTASFPVVLGHSFDPSNRFTVKSGAAPGIVGLKIGSYWPGNPERGLPRHSSTIILIDEAIGRIEAVVEGGQLNAYRTAAADAVATDTLARKDAEVLALFGTGHQARYEAAAVARVRALKDVLVVGRSAASTDAMVADLQALGLPARASSAQDACRAADIIIAATTAREPLFDADWVQPGTHISSMGSDATGKQELPPALFEHARLFCDLCEQSRRIGEFQHAGPEARIEAIGSVLLGAVPGRTSDSEITIFDSSGIAVQDLFIARAILAEVGST